MAPSAWLAAVDSQTLQQQILDTLASSSSIADTRELPVQDGSGVSRRPDGNDDQVVIKGALDSLHTKEVRRLSSKPHGSSSWMGQMVVYETHNLETNGLTPEGEMIVEKGSHEVRVWAALEGKGLTMKELQDVLGAEIVKPGQAKAFRNKWIRKRADGGFERAVGPAF